MPSERRRPVKNVQVEPGRLPGEGRQEHPCRNGPAPVVGGIEQRLILADAITYAIREEKACKVVDIATLTGAMARMLGGVAAGVMANDDAFFAVFS